MHETSKAVVIGIVERFRPQTVLDAPCGQGWLAQRLAAALELDGVDLYAGAPAGYRRFWTADLDAGLPAELPRYDGVVCCEGLEHLGNPLGILRSAREHLEPGGFLVVTTPNTWYPAARLQYLVRGFFPSFPCIAARPQTNHRHLIPWTFPQVHLFLELAGFERIELHAEPLSRGKHAWERVLAWPQQYYCRARCRRAASDREREFWQTAGSGPAVLGRHLIVTARPCVAANARL